MSVANVSLEIQKTDSKTPKPLYTQWKPPCQSNFYPKNMHFYGFLKHETKEK